MEAQLTTHRLHYQRIAPQFDDIDAPVILFLHEALGSMGQWKDFPEALCLRLQLPGIVYERRGHGQSSSFGEKRTAQYLHHYAMRELPEFLAALGENRPLLLVGHSDGGSIALLFAAAFPEKVAGICTMAAHVINEPETISGIAPAIQAYKAGKLDGLKKYHGSNTEALFYAWAEIWQSSSFRKWNITEEISNPNLKGLFIQGKDDQYGTPKQIDLIQEYFVGASQSVLLDRCGHHPHLEQKDAVIEAIDTWWRL